MSDKSKNGNILFFSILLAFLLMISYYFLIAINSDFDFLISNASEYSDGRMSNFREWNISIISLGMQGENLTIENATAIGLLRPDGFLVTNVFPSSNADRARIERGDVILEVDNKYIKNKSDFEFQIQLKKK